MNGGIQRTYAIKIEGVLDPAWSDWLDRLTVIPNKDSASKTMLVGVLDQSALRGVLNKIWDMNLTLISVNPMISDVT